MSSPGTDDQPQATASEAAGTEATAVAVTRRDIADTVYRIARVAGVDPWLARRVGSALAERAAAGDPSWVGRAADDAELVSTAEALQADLLAGPAPARPAHRHRVRLPATDWTHLVARADAFLVPEADLD